MNIIWGFIITLLIKINRVVWAYKNIVIIKFRLNLLLVILYNKAHEIPIYLSN